MIVGILQVELTIDHAQSLKDKRRVVASLKDRLHHDHQVSVAQVDANDVYNRATIGIVMASSAVPQCQSTLDRVLQKIKGHRDCVVSDQCLQILTGQ